MVPGLQLALLEQTKEGEGMSDFILVAKMVAPICLLSALFCLFWLRSQRALAIEIWLSVIIGLAANALPVFLQTLGPHDGSANFALLFIPFQWMATAGMRPFRKMVGATKCQEDSGK